MRPPGRCHGIKGQGGHPGPVIPIGPLVGSRGSIGAHRTGMRAWGQDSHFSVRKVVQWWTR